jgi:hypothetical protein
MLRRSCVWLLFFVTVLSGCIEKVQPDLRSPCAAGEEFNDGNGHPGPCIRRHVNHSWVV